MQDVQISLFLYGWRAAQYSQKWKIFSVFVGFYNRNTLRLLEHVDTSAPAAL